MDSEKLPHSEGTYVGITRWIKKIRAFYSGRL